MEKEGAKELNGGSGGGAEVSNLCLVCTGPLDFISIGQCNHQVCCSLCSMRMRILLHKQECVYCKQKSERVFIVSGEVRHSRRFEGFETYGDSAGPGGWYSINILHLS